MTIGSPFGSSFGHPCVPFRSTLSNDSVTLKLWRACTGGDNVNHGLTRMLFSLVFVLTESCSRVEGARGPDVARLLQPKECSSSRLLVFKPSAHLGFTKGKLIPAFCHPLCSLVDSTFDVKHIPYCSLELFSSLGRRHAALPTIVGTLCPPVIQ